ncbi:hypothetical protein [Methanobacterium alcaliphilum]|uniref:hypothetical protein n=1 Tax=Methanobacterium alcaliphilum TaxID=392018 RepID=UPI002009E2B8|nr:hypothetical protein [Methanobacterium alcaliphilum]MCK9150714.1 hypothetical protein [Methanobacterium alcaliphilum]
MAILTFISSEYQARFLLLSFVPIALLVPLGLRYMESVFTAKKPYYKTTISLLVIGISLIFAFSSFYTASATFSSIGPSISEQQYDELLAIKENATSMGINENTILVSSDFTSYYWIEYVFDQEVQLNNIQNNDSNQSFYYISVDGDNGKENNNQEKLMMGSNVPGSFFLPYGPSLLSNSADVVIIGNQSKMGSFPNNDGKINGTGPHNMTMNNTAHHNLNKTIFNGSKPLNKGNSTPNSAMNNGALVPKGNFSAGGPMNQRAGQGMSGRFNSLYPSGTIVFNGNYVKVYKIST